MKSLNPAAIKVFSKLIEKLKEPGDADKIDKSEGTFMPVGIDFLQRFPNGMETYAVAHRFEQNGDLVPDPDVEFLVQKRDEKVVSVWPLAIDHPPPFVYRRHVELAEDGKPERLNLRGQADLATFCSVWMKNIQLQQELEI